MSGTASATRRSSIATLLTRSLPAVGAYFDVGNCMGQQQYPPHWIEILDSRIKRAHLKDFQRSVGTLDGFCDLLQGDRPWAETMAALRAIGYDRTLTAEMIPLRAWARRMDWPRDAANRSNVVVLATPHAGDHLGVLGRFSDYCVHGQLSQSAAGAAL